MRVLRIALLLLAFCPAAISAVLVARNAVDVPIWDDLERATLLERWNEGSLDWRYVYSPRVEHRMAVPRLLTLANARFADGSLIVEQWFTFAAVVATALLVHVLLRQTFPRRPAALWGLTFLANLLLFSPLQWETFLFGIQTSFVLPPLCMCLALVTLGSRLGAATKLALCALAAAVATNSFSHGVILWGLVFAAALLQRRFGARAVRIGFLATWLVATAGVLVPHFMVDGFENQLDHAYVGVGDSPPGLGLRSLPSRAAGAARFFGAMLGSPLARTTVLDPKTVAPWAALALGGFFALAAAYAVWRHRDDVFWDRCLPWLAMGGFSLVACAVGSIGRSAANEGGFGLIPHYLVVSTYLLLANTVLVALLAEDLRRRSSGRRPALDTGLIRLPAFGAGALLAAQALQWGIGVAGMHEWKSARLQARTSILFINHFEPRYWRRIDGSPEVGKTLLNRLDRAGYLRPALLQNTRLAHFEIAESVLGPEHAQIQRASAAGQLAVRGYAWLPEAGRRADGVLLTVRDARGERIVVAVCQGRPLPRVTISAMDHIFNELRLPGFEEFSPWAGEIDLGRLPDRDEIEVEAWAVDSERMRVHPLSESVAVERTPGGLRVRIRARAPGGERTTPRSAPRPPVEMQ